MKKKILAFTSIRSDYDLMSPLYKLLNEDSNIDFRIIVSGAHLSHSFGYSVEQIRKDGFEILIEIETLLNSDTALSRIKSASLLLQNSLKTINFLESIKNIKNSYGDRNSAKKSL